jgi:hypothetical protein
VIRAFLPDLTVDVEARDGAATIALRTRVRA